MNRLKIKQINDHIYLLNDNDEATGYLITGKTKVLIIDTMNGLVDVHAAARTITDLPIMVVNTHAHPDHIFGNVYFEEVYIHPDDIELANEYLQIPEFVTAIRDFNMTPAAFKPIHEGEIINLGDIELEVFKVSGHTPGGIVLLDRKDRILFTGDSIIEQTWMQLPECRPMKEFYDSLKNLEEIRKDYDYILTGHSRDLEDASLYEAHLNAVREVYEGKNENDEPYEWFGGVCMAHPYGEGCRRIVYNK